MREKLNIALTEEQMVAIREAIASGEYLSSSEIIHEALEEWQLKWMISHEKRDAVRALWDEGVASGSVGSLDMDHLRKDARARLVG